MGRDSSAMVTTMICITMTIIPINLSLNCVCECVKQRGTVGSWYILSFFFVIFHDNRLTRNCAKLEISSGSIFTPRANQTFGATNSFHLIEGRQVRREFLLSFNLHIRLTVEFSYLKRVSLTWCLVSRARRC